MQPNDPITYFAETDHRKKVPFGIRANDRTKHVYVIGKTGMGKSTLLENMAIQDIQSGNGMAFVDPHGKTAELLLEYVPKDRLDDVIYFAPFDMEHPMSFNIMEDVGYDKRHLVANGLMSAFKKIWVDAWSARMEYILSNVIMALLEFPDSTLLGVNRMLTDKGYRKAVVDNIKDPSVRSFWVDEYAKYTDRYTQDATPAIQNKVGQFTANPLVRNIIGQPKSSFDLRQVMDEKKILIINLSKGRIGEGNANLLGSMLITKLYLAAMSRADLHETELKSKPNFYLFVDEFQSFANESFADILSEARKYKLNLTIAHQYIEQMPEEVRSAVFGNVGTMISFRVGAYDAEVLEKEFAPKFYAEDMVNLGFTQIYLKLMINGVSSQPFSATTLPPIQSPEGSFMDTVTAQSRQLYAKPRLQVQDDIDQWYANDFTPEKPKKEGGLAAQAASGHAAPPHERAPQRPAHTHERTVSRAAGGHDRPNPGRRESTERRVTERRDTPDLRTVPRDKGERRQPRQSLHDIKKEAAQKALEEEKKNNNSLKDALALLTKKDTSSEDASATEKPKTMPKPAPRKDAPVPKSAAPAQSVQVAEKVAPPQEQHIASQQTTAPAQSPPATQSERQQPATPQTKPAPPTQPAASSAQNVAESSTETEPLRTPEPPKQPVYDKDFTAQQKTEQKTAEVPEEVLRKVLGI